MIVFILASWLAVRILTAGFRGNGRFFGGSTPARAATVLLNHSANILDPSKRPATNNPTDWINAMMSAGVVAAGHAEFFLRNKDAFSFEAGAEKVHVTVLPGHRVA